MRNRRNIFFKIIVVLFLIFFLIKYINFDKKRIVGQIQIPSIGLNNKIYYGMTQKNLDKGVVTLYENQTSLDSLYGTFILAGHAIPSVFGKLQNITHGTIIFITTNQKKYEYIVTHIEIVNEVDEYIIENKIYYRQLVMVTCIQNDRSRLLIYAKEK